MAEKMTRRTFMKSAAAAAAAISLSGVLTGCGGSGPAQNEVQRWCIYRCSVRCEGGMSVAQNLGSGSNGSITGDGETDIQQQR